MRPLEVAAQDDEPVAGRGEAAVERAAAAHGDALQALAGGAVERRARAVETASTRPSARQLSASGRRAVGTRAPAARPSVLRMRTPPGTANASSCVAPRGRHAGATASACARHPAGAAAVSADDVERAAGEVGDAAARRHGALERPARQRDRPGRGHAPAHLAVGDVDREEARARGDDGVRAVRREIAVGGLAERAHAAARVDGVGDAAPEREDDAVRRARRARTARAIRATSCRAGVRRRRPRPPPAAPPARARRAAATAAAAGARACARRTPRARAAARARRPRSRRAPRSSCRRAVSICSFTFMPRPSPPARRVPGAGAS